MESGSYDAAVPAHWTELDRLVVQYLEQRAEMFGIVIERTIREGRIAMRSEIDE